MDNDLNRILDKLRVRCPHCRELFGLFYVVPRDIGRLASDLGVHAKQVKGWLALGKIPVRIGPEGIRVVLQGDLIDVCEMVEGVC